MMTMKFNIYVWLLCVHHMLLFVELSNVKPKQTTNKEIMRNEVKQLSKSEICEDFSLSWGGSSTTFCCFWQFIIKYMELGGCTYECPPQFMVDIGIIESASTAYMCPTGNTVLSPTHQNSPSPTTLDGGPPPPPGHKSKGRTKQIDMCIIIIR